MAKIQRKGRIRAFVYGNTKWRLQEHIYGIQTRLKDSIFTGGGKRPPFNKEDNLQRFAIILCIDERN